MSSRFEPLLPEILRTEEVRVEDEQFRFTTYEDEFGDIIEKTEYVLEKAPIQRIESVNGILDGGAVEFEKGVDYELSDDQERLVWLDGGDHPDPGSLFYVTYRSESVMGRYIKSHTDELDTVEQDLNELVESKFVDKAEGRELDRIGDIFGTLGRRLGREDDPYRIYLKSIVQSFVSRGTKNDIKTALSAATDVPLEDIKINEDFGENEYEVNIIAATPITGSVVEEVSEIADPSGVEQSRTRFTISPDEVVINDSVDITQGQLFSDELGVTDSTAVNPNKFSTTDTAFADDSNVINPNKFELFEETVVDDESVANRAEANESIEVDDTFAIDPRTTTVSEILGIVEEIVVEPSNKNQHRWEDDKESSTTGWNFFEWTELIELAQTNSETIGTGDAASVPAKAAVISEQTGPSDSVDIPPSDATTSDTGGSDDAVTNVSQTLVAWDTADWNELDWVIEHN